MSDIEYKNKYLKYKEKYINLKNELEQQGGVWAKGNYLIFFHDKDIQDAKKNTSNDIIEALKGISWDKVGGNKPNKTDSASYTGNPILVAMNNIDERFGSNLWYSSGGKIKRNNSLSSKELIAFKASCTFASYDKFHTINEPIVSTNNSIDPSNNTSISNFKDKKGVNDWMRNNIPKVINAVETNEKGKPFKYYCETKDKQSCVNTNNNSSNDIAYDNWYGLYIEVGIVNSKLISAIRYPRNSTPNSVIVRNESDAVLDDDLQARFRRNAEALGAKFDKDGKAI